MGSVIYDFLADSFLFDEMHQSGYYAAVSETAIKKELERYRDFALSNISELHEEIKNEDFQIKIFGSRDFFSIDHLMQTAFYLDQVVLPDLIFPFSHSESDFSKTMNQYLGMSQSDFIDRRSLAAAAQKMKILTPMVAANYLKFFPVSYSPEPGEKIPLTYSENGYADSLPSQILSKYQAEVDVKSLRKSDQHLIVEDVLRIGRCIVVRFKGDGDENSRIYNLFQQKVVEVDDDTRTIQFLMMQPEDPPPLEQFQAWVIQSINKTARAHYDQLIEGLRLSSSFGASYLTSSEFTHSLLGSSTSNENIQAHSSECVLNMDLPFLSNIKMEDLMNVRQNDGEAFELFRRELERNFRELRTETDPEVVKIKIQNAIHELSEVQVDKIDQKIKGLRKGALAQVGIAAGGLAGSVITSGWSMAATAVALAHGFSSYSEYRGTVRENPAYFLWKVKNA